MQTYYVIGIMSGTSLDGVDIAYCKFQFEKKWKYEILQSTCYPYNETWKSKLKNAENTSALELQQLNIELGFYFAHLVNSFITKNNLEAIDFISSHGHTIFHQPKNNLTLQIAAGEIIAAETNIKTICDFRVLDVALGGQGAPLVPIGDQHLFNEFDFCLNIGGFANISFLQNNKMLASDICPANIVLNNIVNSINLPYDDQGMLAAKGTCNDVLLAKLNALEFYHLNFPKSLGKEWVIENINPILNAFDLSIEDILSTFVEHIAIQIAKVCNTQKSLTKILITGGGAYHTFLIDRIKFHTHHQIIIPEKNIIEFKEALIFAFLGVLRLRNEINCLSSVTGARKDNCGGVIFEV